MVIFWGTWARWVALGAAGCVVLAGCVAAGGSAGGPQRQTAGKYSGLLLWGAAVQQCGWWSLYGDLGLWCGLVGGVAALAGAVGFDCAPGHNWAGDVRRDFWIGLFAYALCGATATGLSALVGQCSWGDRWAEWLQQCECEYPTGILLFFTFLSLLFLLLVLGAMREELGRMR